MTSFGEELLTLYSLARSRLEGVGLVGASHQVSAEPDLTIAHSHDPVLAALLATLSRSGVRVNSLCLGSGLSLALLTLKGADVACIHLYDPETNTYNKPYIERLWLGDSVVKVGGFLREVVLAFRRDLEIGNLEELMRGVLCGRFRVALRNRGSGTRAFFEHMLREYSVRLGLEAGGVAGMGSELQTHEDVAKHIASGRADVGLTLRHVAEEHELGWIHVVWEPYECYALKERKPNRGVVELERLMNSELLKSVLNTTPGYRALDA